MPSDLLNIKKIYPDSKIASKFFHYTENAIKNIEHSIPIEVTTLPGWFKFSNLASITESDELRVIAVGSESFSRGMTENLRIVKEHKFLATRNDYKNVEASWHLKYESGTDPWCIYTRSSARRSSKRPCSGTSYRGYLRPDGKVRLAKETYFGNREFASDWKQAITALTADQVVGMKFMSFNIENDSAVRLELWLDELNQNSWKLADSFTDMGDNWGTGATRCGLSNDREAITWGGPIVGFMCEGSSPSNTNYSFSNLTVREINAGGQFTEARAGDTLAIAGGSHAMGSAGGIVADTDTGGGLGDGAGGISTNMDDMMTGTGNINMREPMFTVTGQGATTTTGFPFPFPTTGGTTGTTSSPVGSPSTGTPVTPTSGSSQASERPLVTLYKDVVLMYNIVLDHESACDVGSPFQIDYRQFYSASGVDTQEIKMFAKAGGIVRAGIKARSSISVLVNKVVRKVTVPLRKFGNPTTGILAVEIRDKNGNLVHTFPKAEFGVNGSYPNGGDPAAVSTGAFGPTYTFTSEGNTHRCQTGDMLLFTYSNGTDADANNCIILKSTDKDEIDGFDSVEVKQTYNSTTYTTNQERDFIATLFI